MIVALYIMKNNGMHFFNPLSQADRKLFVAVMAGENTLTSFAFVACVPNSIHNQLLQTGKPNNAAQESLA